MRPERRDTTDRRRSLWWSIAYGSFHPRRRSRRREHGRGFQMVDWHESHLLGAALVVLILCVLDAFMTLVLLAHGAYEVNPIMAQLVHGDAKTFMAVKLIVTGFGVAVLVFLARYHFMRRIKVSLLLYAAATLYAVLIGYELQLLYSIVEP